MTTDTSYERLVRTRIHTSFVTCLHTVLHNHVLFKHVVHLRAGRYVPNCDSCFGCQISVGTNVIASCYQERAFWIRGPGIESNRNVWNRLTITCAKNWELVLIAKLELPRDSTTFLFWDCCPAWLGCENNIGSVSITHATNIRNWKLREAVCFWIPLLTHKVAVTMLVIHISCIHFTNLSFNSKSSSFH